MIQKKKWFYAVFNDFTVTFFECSWKALISDELGHKLLLDFPQSARHNGKLKIQVNGKIIWGLVCLLLPSVWFIKYSHVSRLLFYPSFRIPQLWSVRSLHIILCALIIHNENTAKLLKGKIV